MALTATVRSSKIVWYQLCHHPITPIRLMFSVNNLSPHSYRSACISYFSVSLTKIEPQKQLVGEGSYGLHVRGYIVYCGEDRVVGREDTERALSTLRKRRVDRGWGWHIVSQPAPQSPSYRSKAPPPKVSTAFTNIITNPDQVLK